MHFDSKDDFFDYYLLEHSNKTCRGLHYVGTVIGVSFFITAIVTGQWLLLVPGVIIGYLFAWIGHFFFEHNKPATFTYPWASFKADYRMFGCFIAGKIPEKMAAAERRRQQGAVSSKSSNAT